MHTPSPLHIFRFFGRQKKSPGRPRGKLGVEARPDCAAKGGRRWGVIGWMGGEVEKMDRKGISCSACLLFVGSDQRGELEAYTAE